MVLEELMRFGSQADMCTAKRYVRYTPNSDRKSGHSGCVPVFNLEHLWPERELTR